MTWPLVGRATELDLLERAVIHERRGVVISGPPGVGKTTLLAECGERATLHGFSEVRIIATEASSSLPLGALAPVLPGGQLPHSLWRVDAGRVLRRYSDALVERAAGRPLLLAVDDAHLLDQSSATLVHQLASAGSATVVVAVRAGETAPDPIVALWKDDLLERIDLAVLSVHEVAEVLEAVLDGPVDASTVTEFARRSGGNALFLRELVLTARETGALTFDGGAWVREGPLQPSSRLVELVELRLHALTDDEYGLLELIALAEPFGRAELQQLGDETTITALERAGLVRVGMNGRRLEVRLGHPLYGEIVMAQASALRKQDLARRRAVVIERAGLLRREDVLRVAVWRLAAGGGSAQLLLDAAQLARSRLDHALAEQLAGAAADAGAGFDARFIAAESAFLQGRGDEAERELAALAHEASSEHERARVAVTRFDNALYVNKDLAVGVLDDVEPTIVDPYWRDEIMARRLNARFFSGGPRAVLEVVKPFLTSSREQPSPWVAILTSVMLIRSGHADAAHSLLDRADTEVGVQTAGPWMRPTYTRARAMAFTYAGRLHEAAGVLVPAYDEAVADDALEPRAFSAAGLALLHLQQGRVRLAAERAREAIRAFNELGRVLLTEQVCVIAALAFTWAGDVTAAEASLDMMSKTGLPLRRVSPDMLHARAWIAAAAGDTPTAYGLLAKAQEVALLRGDRVVAASTMYDFARLGQAKRVHESLASLAREIDGHLARAQAAHAEALASRRPEALEAASREFEEMGALLYAAEASADAAVMHRRAGRPRAAVSQEQRAALLTLECDGACTPSLQAIGPRAVLSPAELDTARLAAAGRSNKEIAAQLYLSVRTVENRLQRVYGKLGVSSRAELRSLLEIG